MTAGRPIGQRIRSICEVLEKTGPLGIAGLRNEFPDMEPSNLWRYCNRGVLLGVIKAGDAEPRRIYAAAPNWLTIIEALKPEKKPAPVPRPIKYAGQILTRWVGAMSHMNEVRQ